MVFNIFCPTIKLSWNDNKRLLPLLGWWLSLKTLEKTQSTIWKILKTVPYELFPKKKIEIANIRFF